jgi:transcriptional regulator with XRE-family HTH domain
MESEEIKNIRNKLCVSQEVFARLLNVSFSTINRWENKGCSDKELSKRLKELKELLDKEHIDKEKVIESIKTAGLASVLTLGAVAGLVRSSAILSILGPLGIVGGAAATLATLFLKDKTK